MSKIPIWEAATIAQTRAIKDSKAMSAFIQGLSKSSLSAAELDWIADIKTGVFTKILKTATPYGWTDEIINLVMDVASRIPLDATLSRHNFPPDDDIMFWWFENPINFGGGEFGRIDGIMLAWSVDESIIIALLQDTMDNILGSQRLMIVQHAVWHSGTSIERMLEKSKQKYLNMFKTENPPDEVALQEVLTISGMTSQFLIAAGVWLKQRKLHLSMNMPSRGARKDLQREDGPDLREINGIKVVTMRKLDIPSDSLKPKSEESVEWSHRWIVQGFWRNQPCGPNNSERKLIWIDDFIKGPEDKPLIIKKKVVSVSR